MAPEQAAGRPVDERADLYALGLVLYEALAGVNPVRAGSPSATARRIGTVLPPLAGRRADLPPDLCAALDRAVRPDPEERGELDDLFDALADALGEVSDEGGSIAPHPLERGLPVLPPASAAWSRPRRPARSRGPRSRGSRPTRSLPPPLAAAAVLRSSPCSRAWAGWPPRSASRCCSRSARRRGRARPLLVLVLAAAPPLLLRADGRAWSLPAAAPALGLLGLAGAYPALAGRAPRWPARLALGALGAWWVVLAEPLLERALVFGAAPGHAGAAALRRRARHHRRRRDRAGGELGRAACSRSSGAPRRSCCRGSCAAARSPPTSSPRRAWAAGVAAATVALGEWLGDRVAQPAPHGARRRRGARPARPPWRSRSCAARRRPEPGDEEP